MDLEENSVKTEVKGRTKHLKHFYPAKALSNGEASFQCEWNHCNDKYTNMKKFLLHTAEHVAAFQDPPSNEGYFCLWRECLFAVHSRSEFDRHVYFHPFHTKIKEIGRLTMEHHQLECKLDWQSRNIIPEIPEHFECLFDKCHFPFVSAQDFYWHVEAHVKSVEKVDGMFLCGWEDCSNSVPTRSRLHDHVKRHSQEKPVGCPQCGNIFASSSNFIDHCLRNGDPDSQLFKCSYCVSSFCTERLLREHVKRHINHLKCPQCEMTCTTKATLAMHINYRHSDERPHKCPQCDKGFKSSYDLSKHVTVHSTEANFICFYSGCEYSCRSYETYSNHIKKVHEGALEKPYMCHICEKTFRAGRYLTYHLKKFHDFNWPAGHKRFRYSKAEDGYYRLQTTRFESIELAQLMVRREHNPDNTQTQYADKSEGVESSKNDDENQLRIHIDPKSQTDASVQNDSSHLLHSYDDNFSKEDRFSKLESLKLTSKFDDILDWEDRIENMVSVRNEVQKKHLKRRKLQAIDSNGPENT